MPGAVIAPVLPEIVQQLHLSKVLAGYLVSAHYLTVALFSPFLGILADRIGRVRVLVASLVLFSLSGAAGAFTQSFLPMLATRGLLGIATGGIAAASLGILARLYADEAARSHAIAIASSTLTLANIVYPLLAGWVGSDQWQIAFYLYGIGLPLALIVGVILREQPADSSTTSASLMGGDGGKLSYVLRHPQTLQLLVTLCISSATAYATVIYLPLYLKATINAETAINGIVLASQAIGAAVASAVGVKWLTQRIGSIRAISIGLGLMALALVLIPQLHHLQGLLAVAILFGMGLGVTMPSHYTALANLTPMDLQASILAVGTGMNFLGQFLSPTVFGLALGFGGLNNVFYAAACVAMLTGITLMVTSRQRSQARSEARLPEE